MKEASIMKKYCSDGCDSFKKNSDCDKCQTYTDECNCYDCKILSCPEHKAAFLCFNYSCDSQKGKHCSVNKIGCADVRKSFREAMTGKK